jgi:hypothetical protein
MPTVKQSRAGGRRMLWTVPARRPGVSRMSLARSTKPRIFGVARRGYRPRPRATSKRPRGQTNPRARWLS